MFWYALLKSIFIAATMIRSSSDHAVLSYTYKIYKLILPGEMFFILMATRDIICFKRLTKAFDTLFFYIYQQGPKLNLLNTTIIKSEHGISIDQTYHIIKNIIQ